MNGHTNLKRQQEMPQARMKDEPERMRAKGWTERSYSSFILAIKDLARIIFEIVDNPGCLRYS